MQDLVDPVPCRPEELRRQERIGRCVSKMALVVSVEEHVCCLHATLYILCEDRILREGCTLIYEGRGERDTALEEERPSIELEVLLLPDAGPISGLHADLSDVAPRRTVIASIADQVCSGTEYDIGDL